MIYALFFSRHKNNNEYRNDIRKNEAVTVFFDYIGTDSNLLMTKIIRLTPYGVSLIVLDFPVTFHPSCLSPLLSSRPW